LISTPVFSFGRSLIGKKYGILFFMIEMQATIMGRVQGVRYREFVQVSADTLGVVGYVANNLDGTVLIVAQGWPEVLKEFVEYLHEGSLQAQVEGVAVEWQSIGNRYRDFSIIHKN